MSKKLKIVPSDEDVISNANDIMDEKSKAFVEYIDSGACMFEMSPAAVLLATCEILIGTVNQIAENDSDLAIEFIESFTEDLMKLKGGIKKVNYKR